MPYGTRPAIFHPKSVRYSYPPNGQPVFVPVNSAAAETRHEIAAKISVRRQPIAQAPHAIIASAPVTIPKEPPRESAQPKNSN